MTHVFDKDYWEQHWHRGVYRDSTERSAMAALPPNPYLLRAVAELTPGTALDAGCGAGAEAIALASAGWEVTAADISAEALKRAEHRAAQAGLAGTVRWVEADLRVWEPAAEEASQSFDLVTTHYAHPAMGQLAFYLRIAEWVRPGGTLLIVGHLHRSTHDEPSPHHHPPEEATATAEKITELLDPAQWSIVTAEELTRTFPGVSRHTAGARVKNRAKTLHDVVVQAQRRA